jgi:lipid-A-disaccharide synthase
MKYYIIAGEASGDLHGSNLIKSMLRIEPQANVRCWGGDLMQESGGTLVKHFRDLAFMGFVEVLMNLRTILQNITFCKQDILSFKPDILVLIDYPGFNMRIAKWAKKEGIKVVWYISPQIWAWKQNRGWALKRDVNRMLCILPFEKDFYKKFDWQVDFVGHPLIDAVTQFRQEKQANLPSYNKPIIALLPGSRAQEIDIKLPVMLAATKSFTDYQIVVAGAPARDASFYKKFTVQYPGVDVVHGQTYALLNQAAFALVTSGTATLETALFDVPQVVCYKGGAISYQIAKKLIKVKYISLVNLIMDKPVVKELIQDDMNAANLKNELLAIMQKDKKEALLAEYKLLHQALGGVGASQRAAEIIVEEAKK